MFTALLVGEEWFIERFDLCIVIATVCLTSCYCSLHSIGMIR